MIVQFADSEVSEIQSQYSPSVSTNPRPLLNCLDQDQPEEREVLLDIVREVTSAETCSDLYLQERNPREARLV